MTSNTVAMSAVNISSLNIFPKTINLSGNHIFSYNFIIGRAKLRENSTSVLMVYCLLKEIPKSLT